MRRRIVLALTVAALALAAGCGGDDDDGGGGGGATTDEPPATQTQPEDGGANGGAAPGDGGDGGTAPAGDPAAGEEVFATNCSTCHGNTGAGAATGPSLQEPQLAGATERVRQQVINGGGGMPPFGDQLSDQEIADVTAYVTEELARR